MLLTSSALAASHCPPRPAVSVWPLHTHASLAVAAVPLRRGVQTRWTLNLLHVCGLGPQPTVQPPTIPAASTMRSAFGHWSDVGHRHMDFAPVKYPSVHSPMQPQIGSLFFEPWKVKASSVTKPSKSEVYHVADGRLIHADGPSAIRCSRCDA